ncbi:MAG: ferredoxin reductase family protein [Wenzhouxiangella sp.]
MNSAAPGRGRYRLRSGLRWLALLLVCVLVPLGIAVASVPPSRGFWIEFGAGLGLLGLGLMVAQAVTSGRVPGMAADYGGDNLLHVHRQLGLLAVPLVLAHPVILLLAEPGYLRFLDPGDDLLRAVSLWALVLMLLAILVSSLWRQPLGMSYENWRLLHGGLAGLLLLLGLGHALMVGHYIDQVWQQAALIAFAGLGLWLLFLSRVVRPWRARKTPWEVIAVMAERGQATTLKLRPVGHPGLTFHAGQYAWFTLGSTPFSHQQHPFSFSCSAGQRELCFTAAAVGDFTRGLASVKPGTPVWIEGPMGAFQADPDPSVNLFMVAGGIGITPMMSILRTLQSRNDPRRIRLIYANPDLDAITFKDDLEWLVGRLDLDLIHVLENPPEGWSGRRGQVDAAMLREALADFPTPAQYLTCGPEPLMDIVESSLRDQGADWRRIFSERFEVV